MITNQKTQKKNGQLVSLTFVGVLIRVLIDFHNLVMINGGTLRGRFSGVSLVDFGADWVSAYEPGPDGRNARVAEHTLADHASRRVWRDTQEFDGTWQPVTLHG